MAKGPDAGEPAPDFELPGTDGTFKLSDHRGRRVVLLFYPGDNTTVCTKQFCSYRDREDDMSSLAATVVGISPQSVASHEDFIAANGLTVPAARRRGQVGRRGLRLQHGAGLSPRHLRHRRGRRGPPPQRSHLRAALRVRRRHQGGPRRAAGARRLALLRHHRRPERELLHDGAAAPGRIRERQGEGDRDRLEPGEQRAVRARQADRQAARPAGQCRERPDRRERDLGRPAPLRCLDRLLANQFGGTLDHERVAVADPDSRTRRSLKRAARPWPR